MAARRQYLVFPAYQFNQMRSRDALKRERLLFIFRAIPARSRQASAALTRIAGDE